MTVPVWDASGKLKILHQHFSLLAGPDKFLEQERTEPEVGSLVAVYHSASTFKSKDVNKPYTQLGLNLYGVLVLAKPDRD